MNTAMAPAGATAAAYVPAPHVALPPAIPAAASLQELALLQELHFLVHPLFVGDTTDKGLNKNATRIAESRAQEMAQRYLEVAESMTERAVMCVFLHIPIERLAVPTSAYDASVKTLMDGLFDILGRRLFIFDNRTNPFDGYRAVGRIGKILDQRGFTMDHLRVAAHTYGEVLEECVRDAAENLQGGFEFANPSIVRGALTEAIFWWNTASKKRRAQVKRSFEESGLTFIPPTTR